MLPKQQNQHQGQQQQQQKIINNNKITTKQSGCDLIVFSLVLNYLLNRKSMNPSATSFGEI